MFILDIIGYAIAQFVINIIGAFFRWMIHGFKGTYKSHFKDFHLNDRAFGNIILIVAALFIAIIVIIAYRNK